MTHVFFSFPRLLTAFHHKAGRIAALFAVFLLAACAGAPSLDQPENYSQLPKDDKLRHIVDMQDRLDRVSGTLQIGNADLCRNQVRNLLGFAATNKYSYSSGMTSTASQVFGMDERLQVTNVIPGGGAQRAGLERGDILLTIEGKPVPQGPTAETETVKLLSPIVSKNSSVKMRIDRNGTSYDLVVPLTR
ncbi:MAG: PDZ domain-containing protein, partial [Oxalobacter sp.]|nr:PDZ domain-containing protein [Oxalobacter sp.]